MHEFVRSQTILFYASFDGEVDTEKMIDEARALGKKVALPVIEKETKTIIPTLIKCKANKLTNGHYGIKQPKREKENTVDLSSIEMIIVPGIAFDKYNNRLGRGAGYYDRLLERIPSSVHTVGLAFDFQIVDHIPHIEKHDKPVSHLIFN